jgi:hypothetical protein
VPSVCPTCVVPLSVGGAVAFGSGKAVASTMLMVVVGRAMVAPTGVLRFSVNVSSGSTIEQSRIWMRMVLLVSPGA